MHLILLGKAPKTKKKYNESIWKSQKSFVYLHPDVHQGCLTSGESSIEGYQPAGRDEYSAQSLNFRPTEQPQRNANVMIIFVVTNPY